MSLPGDPVSAALTNLSAVRTRMDSLQGFLAHSVNGNVLLPQHQMDRVAGELAAAVRDVIVNGAALLSAVHPAPEKVNAKLEASVGDFDGGEKLDIIDGRDLNRINGGYFKRIDGGDFGNLRRINGDELVIGGEKLEMIGAVDLKSIDGGDDLEIVEIDAVELLAEHIHFCEICGKGFKRDANLRMHMRAHGNQFKSPESLIKPPGKATVDVSGGEVARKQRFSCPYVGCNRNKRDRNFRPLKSAICVKNHFKRSHCPKMYACNRCRKKSFSVLADLKSHQKHCGGEARWRCTCGTTFSRKDKLFGHVALFEGHMPAIGGAGGDEGWSTKEDKNDRDLFKGLMIGFGFGGGSEKQGRMDNINESVVVEDEEDWSMSMMEEYLNF